MSDENREIVLAPGEYAYMQDLTKGSVKTFVGPCVINQTAQEKPVVYQARNGTFRKVEKLEEAVRKSPVAVEGYYLILKNPVSGRSDEDHPEEGASGKLAPTLEIGRKINIPGPCMFSLWPGQDAMFVRGHHLRSNQYLMVRVYNEDEARANWAKAVVKPATDSDSVEAAPVIESVPDDLTVGRLFVIKGTEVSFYIPPTGVGVVPEGVFQRDRDGKTVTQYVRSALTLERLEYCILIDEDGNKRYERGPAVVFPKPTERFMEDQNKKTGEMERVFRPIELNEIQGIHVKVIADYTEDDGVTLREEGEELFITGHEQQIYFPRQEHAIIKYDGRSKHFATAVPAGEARYVMNRKTGEIDMEVGPTMLLPNPTDHVIVRRVLTETECAQWYPGNAEASNYNQKLRELVKAAPTTRKGAVSEGQLERMSRKKKRGMAVGGHDQMKSLNFMGDVSQVSRDVSAVMGDELTRGSTFTEPRAITLDTKFSGVPAINLWTGFAALIVSKTGNRRVELGPKTVLIGYDETLEGLKLSTEKPKTTDHLLETVYLRVSNNQVSDVVKVRTADRVNVSIKISMWVDFEGDDMERWFSVENYIKFLCDRVRSILKARMRSVRVEELDNRGEDIVREAILGSTDKHPEGLLFEENGMRVKNMEVLTIEIHDRKIEQMLRDAQVNAVASTIEVEQATFNFEIEGRLEEIARGKLTLAAESQKQEIAAKREVEVAQITAQSESLEEQTAVHGLRLAAEDARLKVNTLEVEVNLDHAQKRADQELDVSKARDLLAREMLTAETESVAARFAAASNGFTEAVAMLTDRKTLVEVSKAMSVQQIIGGDSVVDVIGKVFDKTPLKGLVDRVASRSALPAHDDDASRRRSRDGY
jgi:major vault protein